MLNETQRDLIATEIDSLTPASPVNRRGFLAASTLGGFAMAVAPTGELLAQVIKTDAADLDAGMTTFNAGGTDVAAYYAKPKGKTDLPVILVVQEIFGVHEYIKDTCRRFAKQGYLALAVELFQRQGDASKFPEIADVIKNVVSKVPDAQVMSDLDAGVAWAVKNGGDAQKLAITGFCWGGRITWLYSAHNPMVKAGVAWYGRLGGATSELTPKNPHDIAAKLNGPVLGLYGGADTGIPQNTVEEMREKLQAGSSASKASQIIVYPDTPHAFHADYRPSYRKPVAEQAWTKCLAWLKTNGVA
jgi:carboxymethylenebutenolidase